MNDQTAYYATHRSLEGKAKMAAWYRARRRALQGLSRKSKYRGEAQELLIYLADTQPRRRARQAAQRELARRHPGAYRTVLTAELAKEPDYHVALRRGPKPRETA